MFNYEVLLFVVEMKKFLKRFEKVRFTAEETLGMIAAYRNRHIKIRAIIQEFNLRSNYYLYKLLKEHNIPLRKTLVKVTHKKKLTKQEVEQILTLYKDKQLEVKQIKQQLNIDANEFYNCLNARKVMLRTRERFLEYEQRFKSKP